MEDINLNIVVNKEEIRSFDYDPLFDKLFGFNKNKEKFLLYDKGVWCKLIQKKILTIGTSSIKVEISKGKIIAEGKTIDADNLSKLVHDMNGSKQYNLPWNIGFGSSVVIGCSIFKQGELNSVLEAYDEINNTSFALLPF